MSPNYTLFSSLLSFSGPNTLHNTHTKTGKIIFTFFRLEIGRQNIPN